MNQIDIEVILAFADSNMNASSAARKMYVHRNTVEYHLAKVRSETGLNPKEFRGLAKLLTMIEEGSTENG